MPIENLRCANGHTAEMTQSFTAVTFSAPELMPQTGQGTYAGDHHYLRRRRRRGSRLESAE